MHHLPLNIRLLRVNILSKQNLRKIKMKSYTTIPTKIHEETVVTVEEKGAEDGEVEVRIPGIKLGLKLFRFSYLLSVTGFVATTATLLLRFGLSFYLSANNDLVREYNLNQPPSIYFQLAVVGNISIILWACFWSRMILESKNENISLIEKYVKIHSYVSSLLNSVLQVAVVLFIALHENENQQLSETIANFKVTVTIVILTGIIATCGLIYGLRTKQSGYLKYYIIFRYLLLIFTIIAIIVVVTLITIYTGVWWTPLCGLLVLTLVCLFSVLDLGPTIILHSIWIHSEMEIPKLCIDMQEMQI